ncbi:MAG: TolC family protein [Calditrichae bacterium]|nr:TolC family protein [Calditrichota bacterium]MCB9057922.1 TolC family protein [Calditrichia bacterium]
MKYIQVLLINLMVVISASGQRILNFDDAMQIARENSPDIQQARLSLQRSQELLNAQEAGLKSQFSLSVEPIYYARSRSYLQFLGSFNDSEEKRSGGTFSVVQPVLWTDGTLSLRNNFEWRDTRSEFGGDSRNKIFSNNLILAFDQPLFTYNRLRLALENVKTDLDYAYLNYVIQELQLEQRVAQLFYRVYQNKLARQVTNEDLANTEQSYEIIKNKVNAGLAAQEELYQAELNLITSRSAVQNSEVTLQNSLDQLKQIIGMDIYEDISVVAGIEQTKVQIEMDRIIKLGLANRLELRQRQLDIRNSKASLIQAEATNEFKGNLSLSYGFIGNDEQFNQVLDKPDENQTVSISFDIPIYDWGEQASREKAARASVRNSEINLEQEKINIVINLRQTYRSLQNQVLQIDLARQNVKIAQQTYDINLERYENGDLTSMDLNLFQNQLSEKKNSLIDAQINYKLLLLDLKVQTLWDFENDQPVDTELLKKRVEE